MKLPRSYYNWLSIVGSFLALFFFVLIILMFAISRIFDIGASYIGLLIYIILPMLMVLGIILIFVGMLISKRRERKRNKGIEPKRLPSIDLNKPNHRNAFVFVTIITVIFLFLSSIGSYEAFHYTESIEFCGTLCHKVMEPEYVAYQNSPHAKVKCVECHVGEGADWYVKSKLSGLYQVYSVIFKKYPQPITTPVHSLRPARETCEKCHWPQKFYGRKMRVQKSFLADSLNTEWDIVLQMKIGSLYPALGLEEGIHKHINPNVKIEFISDESKEEIQWVKYTNTKTFETYIYKSEDYPVTDSFINASAHKTMDCIDCHNRPSHNYNSPPTYLDGLLTSGKVSKTIPQFKYISMEVLKEPYENSDTADFRIQDGIVKFYVEKYPEYYKNNKDLVSQAIANTIDAYHKNSFPGMKVTYDIYPDHIGHLESRGCFRCHNGTFKSEDGSRVISRDCNICHIIMGQGVPGNMQNSTFDTPLDFKHPIDIEEQWKEYDCSECHTYLY